MNDSERLSRLRHDLSNPLSALLAETQLLLLNESQIDPETLTSLREIEALAIRMRTMLREIWGRCNKQPWLEWPCARSRLDV